MLEQELERVPITMGRDDLSRLEKQIDEMLAAQKAEIDGLSKVKEQEILKV
jgi:ribosome recycling factor